VWWHFISYTRLTVYQASFDTTSSVKTFLVKTLAVTRRVEYTSELARRHCTFCCCYRLDCIYKNSCLCYLALRPGVDFTYVVSGFLRVDCACRAGQQVIDTRHYSTSGLHHWRKRVTAIARHIGLSIIGHVSRLCAAVCNNAHSWFP
jgi:hypothetical protein